MGVITDPYASYKLLAKALVAKGYKVEFSDEHSAKATFTKTDGATWQTRAAHITYPFNTERARKISINKALAYDFAKQAGFTVPFTKVVDTMPPDDRLQQLIDAYHTLIVKPESSSLSNGLTLGVTEVNTLKKAITYAQAFSSRALVQEQVRGEEIRFAVVNGKVKAALLRQTARVVGDGISTIGALVAQENMQRRAIKCEYITYPELDERLVPKELLTNTRIPGKGEIVQLNYSTMIRGGCSVYNVTDEVDKSYIRQVEDLVSRLDTGFIAVDIFCQNFKELATNKNHWFIEFNTAPVLKLFYACRDGKQFDIVHDLADMIDAELHG